MSLCQHCKSQHSEYEICPLDPNVHDYPEEIIFTKQSLAKHDDFIRRDFVAWIKCNMGNKVFVETAYHEFNAGNLESK